jgi:two-component system response regulator AtoC
VSTDFASDDPPSAVARLAPVPPVVRAAPGAASRVRPAAYAAEFAPLFEGSPRMRDIREIVEAVAETGATLLIRGESGVGKDLVARAVHAASASPGPLVKVNCAALPGELLESELFGHEKGAFTGAYRRKLGKFEFASNGTIFLDEIGDLPLPLQAKLLSALQDRQFYRVGGRELITVNARAIAATNRDLDVAMRRGEFREDLYYRLAVVEIQVPPLRDRREEIPGLAAAILAKVNLQYGRAVELPPETLELFLEHDWPGNVREMENAIRRLVVLGNPRLVHDEIATRLRAAPRPPPRGGPPPAPEPLAEPRPPPVAPVMGLPVLGLKDIARRAALEAERKALIEVLAHVQWNRVRAARMLKVSYKTLLNKIAEFKLSEPRQRRSS